jgi:hypothetical protein
VIDSVNRLCKNTSGCARTVSVARGCGGCHRLYWGIVWRSVPPAELDHIREWPSVFVQVQIRWCDGAAAYGLVMVIGLG